MMKRTGFHRPKISTLPIDWQAAERAMLQANAADTCDARVSEDIFDIEDERVDVDILDHCRNHGLN